MSATTIKKEGLIKTKLETLTTQKERVDWKCQEIIKVLKKGKFKLNAK